MCGINGFNFRDAERIGDMNHRLSHRGPDGSSVYVSDAVSLGHTRLSIIDLSALGNQPMDYTKDGKTVKIVFNGEIYNYIEVREKLKALGYDFHTESDTEVILVAYLEWGELCVNELNGMWAFCIFDAQKNTLFCSRDRLGVKPFYYYSEKGKFIFSSELKSVVAHETLKINTLSNINPEAVQFFFSQGFIPSPLTIYSTVFKLKASHNLVFDLGKQAIIKLYPYFSPIGCQYSSNKQALIEEGTALLSDAVKLRMRSDVPVGAFLSGGLDSSTVVGVMKDFTELSKLHTFSIGFEEKKYDETPYINLVKDKFKTEHHHHYYPEADFSNLWERYSNVFDEPFGDYSSFPSHRVSQLTRQYVTVALSGDGGDEIFGGYPLYNNGFMIDKLRNLPVFARKALLNIVKNTPRLPISSKLIDALNISLVEKNQFHATLHASERFNSEVYNQWTVDKLKECLSLCQNDMSEALRLFDLYFNTLPDKYLTKVDRTSMANSLEVRSPFLDYRFVAYAQKIPPTLKVNWQQNKILMREIIKDIIPQQILQRGKMGFTCHLSTKQ